MDAVVGFVRNPVTCRTQARTSRYARTLSPHGAARDVLRGRCRTGPRSRSLM
jgi:hypothetical protein